MSNLTASARHVEAPFPCPSPDVSSLIKAHSNCLGRSAERKHPELRGILTAEACDCLEYDDSRRDDGQAERLRQLIGERERCSAKRVLLGGSGLDRIPMIAAALGVNCIARLEGDFFGYDRYCLLTGVERRTIPLDRRTRAITPEALAAAVRDIEDGMLLLTFGGTNPLQTRLTRKHVKAAHDANPTLVIIVDGAYRQYDEHFYLAELADEFDRVIYLQVASKDIFLPGARLSWIVPSARFAARLAEVQPPFPLNTAGVRQAIALLERPDLLIALRGEQASAREVLINGLGQLNLTLISGEAPWVVLQWPGNAKPLVDTLEHRFGILVQQQALAPLDESWVRISATTCEEAGQIVGAIMSIIVEGLAR